MRIIDSRIKPYRSQFSYCQIYFLPQNNNSIMKCSILLISLAVSAQAFAPAPQGRTVTSRDALFNKIFDMDLFAPKKDQNTYGARNKKNLKQGKITESSYIPAGLTKAQYEKVRAGDQNVKDTRYAKNVAKAGKFTDYTAWYTKRGTDTKDDWSKSATKGHDMAKTKYDWSGATKDTPLWAKQPKK